MIILHSQVLTNIYCYFIYKSIELIGYNYLPYRLISVGNRIIYQKTQNDLRE
ncbi:hypothetical protein XIS1_510012 [Xenorhabdus innexi]|uniref:Uncharacterized protein n=1 Tax=Xenorhabdus innexi TaxID=290109 RepID=A0A1N6MYY1_9GAMM|nr:hypothetical protein XIS1_510012 [Xenorhabdus innexi]